MEQNRKYRGEKSDGIASPISAPPHFLFFMQLRAREKQKQMEMCGFPLVCYLKWLRHYLTPPPRLLQLQVSVIGPSSNEVSETPVLSSTAPAYHWVQHHNSAVKYICKSLHQPSANTRSALVGGQQPTRPQSPRSPGSGEVSGGMG